MWGRNGEVGGGELVGGGAGVFTESNGGAWQGGVELVWLERSVGTL